MTQYINKSALVAEIKRRVEAIRKAFNEPGILSGVDRTYANAQYDAFKSLLTFLNSLEVKEVDLEKEFYDFLDTLIGKDNGHLSEDELFCIAKYFYELGLQVNNPVTAADRGFAEEIIINLKRVENDYHLDLTREMEWLRNKTKKGE